GQARECVDQVITESDRMRRSKAEPLKPVDPVHRFEQLHKWAFIVDLRNSVPAVQIHNLSEQRDFLHSARHQIAYFAHDLIYRTTTLRSARLRDDAKCAMHIASLHDRNESGRLASCKLLLANCLLRAGFLRNINNREARVIHSAVAGIDDFGDAVALPRDQFVHVIRVAMEFLSPDDEVDMRQILQQRLATGLPHAAKETE